MQELEYAKVIKAQVEDTYARDLSEKDVYAKDLLVQDVYSKYLYVEVAYTKAVENTVDEEESHSDVVTAPEFPEDFTEEDSEEEKTAKTRGNH